MTDRPGWYPPGQVCYPPELPPYLKHVHHLKPIVGAPRDEEVIGIHSVILAANRVSGVPGMHDPGLLMKLSDHLFSVQMAKYRSKYSLITFPRDATYTPPTLPAHVSANLESVAGAPSDEEIVEVQDALRAYQYFSSVPSMFDAHVNMELSQHLFSIQMARYMRLAGESEPRIEPQASANEGNLSRPTEWQPSSLEEPTSATNNAGTGRTAVEVHQTPQLTSSIDVRELMERSNQLAERFNLLLERSNELVERSHQPTGQPNQQLSQVLDRLTQLVEKTNQPVERPDEPTERFNQLFERFNQLLSDLGQPTHQSNQLSGRLNQLVDGIAQSLKRSNKLSEKANQLAEQQTKLFDQSNILSELVRGPVKRMEGVIENINRVLVGIQHAIVRSYKDNTLSAMDCLVNEKGETPGSSETTYNTTFGWLSENLPLYDGAIQSLAVSIGGVPQDLLMPEAWLAEFLRFYGIGAGLVNNEDDFVYLEEERTEEAGERLRMYLTSCLG